MRDHGPGIMNYAYRGHLAGAYLPFHNEFFYKTRLGGPNAEGYSKGWARGKGIRARMKGDSGHHATMDGGALYAGRGMGGALYASGRPQPRPMPRPMPRPPVVRPIVGGRGLGCGLIGTGVEHTFSDRDVGLHRGARFVGRKVPQALQSKAFGANFLFATQMPPAYQKFNTGAGTPGSYLCA
jgi:hypothetical protein